jgi:hypothetical protein
MYLRQFWVLAWAGIIFAMIKMFCDIFSKSIIPKKNKKYDRRLAGVRLSQTELQKFRS